MEPYNPSRLRQYQNAKVKIYYNSTTTWEDVGHVSYMDENWVEITKDNNERLLVPVMAIRLIKLLEPSVVETDSDILLRPSGSHLPDAEPRRLLRE
jgi:hypothetical protein